MTVFLEKFVSDDIRRLEEIMNLNKDSAGERSKDWSKFIQWNIENPEDLYWKIMLDHENFVGYIGYADATRKPTTKYVSIQNDLFLEIYLHPDYTGKGIGEEAFNQSLELIPKLSRKIFASTYISNTRAQNFFSSKLDMKIDHYDKKYNVVVYVKKI